MKANLISIGIVTALFAGSAVAQPEKHPEAEKAMAKIVLQKDFGKQLKFHSREVVTVARNDKVPGLNGLMFMYWWGDAGITIKASVVWFEKKDDLLKFYASTTQGNDYKLGEFNGTRIWKMGKDGYTWTDGEHFMVSLGGPPLPPEEMVKDWLGMIGSKVAEIEKQRENERAPGEPIPDKPAAGKVQGREFKVEEATLKEGCLKLRQGEGFSSHLEEFEIDLSRKKVENFSGKTFTVELNQKADIDITLAYSGERKGTIKTRTYLGDYTMKLEFGTAKDGKLPGKIHLRLPAEAGSFVVGTFEAETK